MDVDHEVHVVLSSHVDIFFFFENSSHVDMMARASRPSASQPRDRHPLTVTTQAPPAARSGLEEVPVRSTARSLTPTHGPRLDVAVASRFPNLTSQPSHCTRSQQPHTGLGWVGPLPSASTRGGIAPAVQRRTPTSCDCDARTNSIRSRTPPRDRESPPSPFPSRRLRGIVRGLPPKSPELVDPAVHARGG